MKRKKSLACLLTALLLVVCLFAPGCLAIEGIEGLVSREQGENGLTFEVYDDGTCYVSGDEKVTKGDVIIPSESPTGEPVTYIGDFFDCKEITSVKIPEGATGITTAAFYGCDSLTSVELPASMADIGSYAFQNCAALRRVTVAGDASLAPVDGSCVGEAAFHGCTALEEVELPDCITEIWMYAFQDCTSLKNIHLPDGLQTIYYAAFSGCTALAQLEIPASTLVASGAVSGCTGLQAITVAADHPVYRVEGNCLIEKDTNWVTLGYGSFTIPADATGVRGYAFAGQTAVTDVVLPERLEGLGDSAFEGCTGLRTVTIDSADVIQQVWFGVNTAGLFEHESAVYVRADIEGEAPDWFTQKYPYAGEVTKNGTTYRLYGTAPATLTDEETGVQVEAAAGVLPAETVLTVEPSTYKLEGVQHYTAFDISLERDGVKVQPNGKVKVTLPIPAGYDKAKLTVYRVEADGSKTELPCTVNGDAVTFETDHFSVYLLAEKAATPATEATESTESTEDAATPPMGEKNALPFFLALAGAAAILLGLCIRRRVREN